MQMTLKATHGIMEKLYYWDDYTGIDANGDELVIHLI